VSRSKPIDPVDLVNELKYLLLTKVTIPRINAQPCVNVVSDPNGQSVVGRAGKIEADQLKSQFHAFSKNVVSPGIKENIAVLLCDGSEFLPALMLFFP
jgi:hypothetical protein